MYSDVKRADALPTIKLSLILPSARTLSVPKHRICISHSVLQFLEKLPQNFPGSVTRGYGTSKSTFYKCWHLLQCAVMRPCVRWAFTDYSLLRWMNNQMNHFSCKGSGRTGLRALTRQSTLKIYISSSCNSLSSGKVRASNLSQYEIFKRPLSQLQGR